jgi:hypothetical protein
MTTQDNQVQALQQQAIQLGQQTVAAASQTLQQQVTAAAAAAAPAMQQTVQQLGKSAGHGAREGLLGDFTNGEVAVIGVAGVIAAGLLGWVGYKAFEAKPMNALRAYSNGNVVAVDEGSLREFADQWPASGLRGLRGVTFEYDTNGLVDVRYRNGSSEDWDGPALAALSHDAEEYGAAARDRHIRADLRQQYRREGRFPWWWPERWGT